MRFTNPIASFIRFLTDWFTLCIVPQSSGQNPDLLDPRFQRIFHEQYPQQDDMLPEMFPMIGHNGRNNMMFSSVGSFQDWDEFSGTVNYQSLAEGYDTTMTYVEFASGFQIERTLMDDDQYQIMDQKPAGLATAARRTRQKHAARILNNAFSTDTYFYNNSENVALCSNSHTTRASGVSTSTGFDNLVTTSLSATAVSAARIQASAFRDDVGNRIDVNMDELWYPEDLFETAFEIVNSMGKVETANNNRNVHYGAYTLKKWRYLTDTNNWFLADSSMRKQMVGWVDRVAIEFAMAEDLDTIVGKWRGYMRYANAWWDWRWICGAQVS